MLKRELFLSNNSGTIACGGTEKLQAEHWIEIDILRNTRFCEPDHIHWTLTVTLSAGQTSVSFSILHARYRY